MKSEVHKTTINIDMNSSKSIQLKENQPTFDTLKESNNINEQESNLQLNTKNKFDIIYQMKQANNNNKLEESLLFEVEEKNREIEKLNVLLESIAPIPGFDYEKLRKMVLMPNIKHDDYIDYRDTKIVSLAKKSRNLTVQLNKERAENDSLQRQVDNLQLSCENLKQEISLLKQGTRNKPSKGNDEFDLSSKVDELNREIVHMTKLNDDFKKKNNQSADEIKLLKSILSKELGDGVNIEQASEANWKGRAQQIVFLKSKIRRLESQLQQESKQVKSKVDIQAEKIISNMENERQIAIENITEDYEKLKVYNTELETKVSGSKARIKNLETEQLKMKQQLQVVLEKTSSDDELIELQKVEIEKLKKLVHDSRVELRKTQEASNKQIEANDSRKLQLEIQRLERLCKSQTQQLSTQDTLIRELRSSSISNHY